VAGAPVGTAAGAISAASQPLIGAADALATATGADQVLSDPVTAIGSTPVLDPTGVGALPGPLEDVLPLASVAAPIAALAILSAKLAIAGRSPGCAAQANVVWSSVRLIPCLARDAVGRQLSTFAGAFSSARTAAFATLASSTESGAVAGAVSRGGLHGDHRLVRAVGAGAENGDWKAADRGGFDHLLVAVLVAVSAIYAALVRAWYWLDERSRPWA
jgi:hypothetical protein